MVIFLIAGFFSGILSLSTSIAMESLVRSLVFFDSIILGTSAYLEVLAFVLIEELSKFLLIYLTLKNFFSLKKIENLLLRGFLFGLGFGFFELNLIFLSGYETFYFKMMIPVLIHVLTSIILFAAFSQGKNTSLSGKRILFFFFLALLIHLCYNLFVSVNNSQI